MTISLTTGGTARLLKKNEPQIADLVRRGKIDPEPPIAVGRRQWFAEHVLQAAEALGVLTEDLRARIELEVSSETGTAKRAAPEGLEHAQASQ